MAGPEIVYTVHKFEAENVDEISINVGEQVIVLEKDEGFNDGWWQGRNIRGQVGLFPISYTVPQPTLENKIDSLENTISEMKVSTTSVEKWTSEQVAQWLIQVGFEKELASMFKDQEISGDILLELTLDSLKELQVTTFGKRFKIHSAINTLRKQNNNNKQQTKSTSTPTPNHIKPATNNIEARVASPFPDLTKGSHNHHASAIHNYYQSNKGQPYMDDDLVSDYSTVIRNSRLAEPKTIIPPPRPSIPLDMDLIASQPRLSTLLERQGSISSINQEQLQRQSRQLQEQQLRQRPVSHQVTPYNGNQHHYKRNTMNHIEDTNRYNLMRTSLVSYSKLNSVIPNTNMVRRSEDVSLMQSEVNAQPDMEGWLYKQGDKYKTWNKRWFVLKSNNLFYFKSHKAVRMKGIINLKGYRIQVDEGIQPGKYCFKVRHDRERTFYFYTDFEKSMKEWLKALMKATIARDFATPVMSSSTIPTVSLEQARKMRPRPPSTIFQQKDHRIITNYELFSSQQPSRAPSVMSQRMQQQRVLSPMNDHGSEYFGRLKDSGFNSTHNLTRSVTKSSKSSNSKQEAVQTTSSIHSVPFYPDQEEEDLIDPEHMSVIEVNRHQEEDQHTTMLKKQARYVDWINAHNAHSQITRVTDLAHGEPLIELLEVVCQKEIMRPINNPTQSQQVQKTDRVIAAFKFMAQEGIELDGLCSVRDVLNTNEEKIMYMMDAIKMWYSAKQTVNTLTVNTANGKKMASGGTFGEEDQIKLREMDEESILPLM